MNYNSIKILILFLFPFSLFGQNARIDSLNKVLRIAVDKRVQADLLHHLASETWDYDFEKSLKYAQQSLRISSNIGYEKGIVQTSTDIGLYYYFTGDYKLARRFFREALRSDGHNYGDFPAYTYMHLGNIFRTESDFDSARWYYDKAIALAESPASPEALSMSLYNKGMLYYNFSSYSQAMNYWQRAMSIRSKLKDIVLLAESWKSMGMAHKSFMNLDSSRYYFEKVYRVAIRENNPELKTFYYLNAGELHFIQGEIKDAITSYGKALELLEAHDYKSYHAIVLKRIGEVYESQGYYQRAVEYFLNALRINEQLRNKQEEGWTIGMIGSLYAHQRLDSMALRYELRSLKIQTGINDKAGIAFSHNLLGSFFLEKGDFRKAMEHYAIALKLREEMGYVYPIAEVVYNIGRLYQTQGKYDKALLYQQKVLGYYTAGGNKTDEIRVLNTLGVLSVRARQYQQAKAYLDRSNVLALFTGNPIQLRDNYKSYAALFRAEGNYALSLKYVDLYESLNDTIFSSQSASRIAELNALYQLERKEKDIQSLSEENTQKLEVIRLHESRIKLQNIVLIFSALCVSLLLAAAVMLYRYYRTKSKAHKQLRRFNREISEKNEEIQAQSQELVEANAALVDLNYELVESKEEIEAQSEELREANETIQEINRGLENTVNKRTSQLKEAYKELDTFFYRSSHDFRRPLTTFMGLAEVAKITVKDQSALELFSKVSETANNLDKMLVKLQSISDVGAQQLVYKEVLFKEIFESLCDTFRAEIQQKNIAVTCEVILQESFNSYPAMIKIIIENLLENAINFCGVHDPYIDFRVERTQDVITIEMRDNGQGIPDEYHKRIFEMYFRGNERSKGNGLGLYIVEKAVGKLNGTIRVQSKVNQGTVFSIELPVK